MCTGDDGLSSLTSVEVILGDGDDVGPGLEVLLRAGSVVVVVVVGVGSSGAPRSTRTHTCVHVMRSGGMCVGDARAWYEPWKSVAKSISVISLASSWTYFVPTGTFSTAQRGNSTCAPVTAVKAENPDSAGIALNPNKTTGSARSHSCLRALAPDCDFECPVDLFHHPIACWMINGGSEAMETNHGRQVRKQFRFKLSPAVCDNMQWNSESGHPASVKDE